ncbi:DUF974-domain-containing protein [Gonapodya prolifera JEL478]|uniref:DUF974-domain-containing protein n=1 Tax=Gonapodya prolifera (strain JEL478) TaxID=1344416 RepID=A0A139AX06_GONPJ|nr:DUF974-domain-containing protein [Gonapodya prolifera JEL478]|eukprot:KXS21234.1 DUF974-domain-containing protein [Gonapodya prolifera JEL478]
MADAQPPQQPHPLHLKVMRLSAPAFVPSAPIHVDPSKRDPVSMAIRDLLYSDPLTLRDSPALAPPPDAPDASPPPHPPQPMLSDLAISGLLSLPTSFGSIYLGETFASYISINNESLATVQAVGVKVEMQTSAHRFTLVDTTGGMPSTTANSSTVSLQGVEQATTTTPASLVDLAPHRSSEHIVRHEIKELGTHILVCSVHYSSPSSGTGTGPTVLAATPPNPLTNTTPTPAPSRRTFRKFYKFQVSNPLSVRTKVNSLSDGRVFLEAQVHNAASAAMFIERMRFEPGNGFAYVDLNYVNVAPETGRAKVGPGGVRVPASAEGAEGKDADGALGGEDKETGRLVVAGEKSAGGVADRLMWDLSHPTPAPTSSAPTRVESTFGPTNLLHPTDVRQYLYILHPRHPSDPLTLTTATLGKLDIQWRGPMGEVGRLQTSQLSRKVPPLETLDVLPGAISPGDVVPLERPFRITVRIRNNDPADAVRVVLQASGRKAMGSVLLRGPSTYHVGDVPPRGGVREVQLEYVPVVAGLHRVGGFRVVDLISGAAREVEGVAEVFVVDDGAGEEGVLAAGG